MTDTRTDVVIWTYCGACDATHQDGQHTRTADQPDYPATTATARTADQVARQAASTADRLAGLPVPVADVVSLATRAATRAATTYRLARYGQDAADVVADVLADMLADVAAGTFPNVADQYGQTDRDQLAAVLAVRARRVADRYRRDALRETVGGTAADVVDGPTVTDQDAATATADRARAAVLARTPRNMAADRSDVLAVGDWARENMRSAETVALGARDRSAVLSAMAAPYVPPTATQRAAWHELTDQHGQDGHRGWRSALREYRDQPDQPRPTVPVLVGWLSHTRTAVPAVIMPDRAGMRALRSADRDAARMSAMADRSRSVDPLAAAVAGAWRDAARAARMAHDAAIAHGGRPARIAVDWQPVTVDVPVPVPDVADLLAAGYLPESLAERATTGRPRGAVDDYRRIRWADVLPTSTETARTQVAKAARGWAETVTGRTVHQDAVPVLPVAARAGKCANGQDRYQSATMAAGPRWLAVRAGGVAARAGTATATTARTAAAARDRLADRLAVILPVPVLPVPVVTGRGVVGENTGPTVLAGLADWSVLARAAIGRYRLADWLADRLADWSARGETVADYQPGQDRGNVAANVAAAARAMVADW